MCSIWTCVHCHWYSACKQNSWFDLFLSKRLLSECCTSVTCMTCECDCEYEYRPWVCDGGLLLADWPPRWWELTNRSPALSTGWPPGLVTLVTIGQWRRPGPLVTSGQCPGEGHQMTTDHCIQSSVGGNWELNCTISCGQLAMNGPEFLSLIF